MPLGFEHGTVVPSSSQLDSPLTEEESQLSLYSSLVDLDTIRAPSWSPLTAVTMTPSSSPLSSPPQSQSQRKPTSSNPDPKVRHYRPAAPLPFELAQHVLIYFEELLHLQAFTLLISLLSSGASSFDPKAPAVVPSPPYLALAATLSVHPRMTTKTLSREHHEQANAALRLLRLTNKVVGPINANFSSAFEFKHYDHNPRKLHANPESSQEAQPEPPIDSIYAGAKSIFSLAEDFWQVVGWAFNCSCLESMYAARWSQWSLWLDFMIQALEADWELRFHNKTVEQSLILQFIESAASSYGRERRIMRAIFADGSPKSLNEFKEVFRNEISPPKTDSDKPKKREVDKLDIEADIYGDYMAGNDEDDSEEEDKYTPISKSSRTRTPSTRRITPRTSNQSLKSIDTSLPSSTTASTLGPPTAITLRHRLLHLLSHVSGCASTIPSFLELDELYSLIAEFVRPLPLPIFIQFIVSLPCTFSPDAHTTLLEILLQGMLENVVDQEIYLTSKKMVETYLPFGSAKGDVGGNARVSVVLEGLVRGMGRVGALDLNGMEVREAVKVGVRRRGEALTRERRGKEGEEAAAILRESGWGLLRGVGAEKGDDEEEEGVRDQDENGDGDEAGDGEDIVVV